MHIAIAHNAVTQTSAADELDVMVQVEAVQSALTRLGNTAIIIAVDLNLAAVSNRINNTAPDMVFNLVESLAGSGQLIHCFPSVLDALGRVYTGASAESLFLTSNKILAKTRLHFANVTTPMWVKNGVSAPEVIDDPQCWPKQWIIKSVWEHASIGLDAGAIIQGSQTPNLPELLSQRAPLLGGACFVEAFIEGREFNLSVIDGPDGPCVLPVAEIVFEGYRDDQPRIVDYNAKWDPGSYAYHHTPRSFDFRDKDNELIERLKILALKCWDIFGLKGYARIDFRVDTDNQPWVLEVNANPCISPDAGFAAAIEQAGMTYEQAIDRIITAARL